MKKKLLSTLMVISLVMIMSANQTRSQKQASKDTTTVREAAVDSVRTPATKEVLLDSLSTKIDKIAERIDRNAERASRIENKVNNIQYRQVKIRMALTPTKVDPGIMHPVAYQLLPVNPDSIVIKPVEPEKRSWWRRKFKIY